jgi:hypothetical protein
MADQHAIRPITDDEYAAFRLIHEHSFNDGPAPADIALDVRELGAAYLGGTRLGALGAAGRH